MIYADSGGSPSSLIAVSNQLTFASTNAAGWYDLTFATPVKLAAGTYWIGFMSGATSGVAGFRWDSVSASRALNSNTFTSGPSNPFGSFTTDSEQMSLYATYTTQTACAGDADRSLTPSRHRLDRRSWGRR